MKEKIGQFKQIPQEQQTIAKQVGISAPRLERRIRAEEVKFKPILESVSQAAQETVAQQQFAESELGKRLGYLVAQQEKELRPFFEARLPLLQDRLAREQANYSLEKQRELDLLLENIRQQGIATQAELNRAHELALAEANYQNSLDKIKFSTNEAIRQAKALQELRGKGIAQSVGGAQVTGGGYGNLLKYVQPRSIASSISSLW